MGWKVTIRVPQPNGREHHHVWVAAIPDERDAREKLLLPEIPCEARVEVLSSQELASLALEPGEVRRVA
jgi:hypothetical protein